MITTNERGYTEARCDHCLAAPTGAEGIRTWPARAQALAALVSPELGWQVARGRLVCAWCALRVDCEAEGHAWGSWHPIPGTQLAERTCRRCRSHDRAPDYVLIRAHGAA